MFNSRRYKQDERGVALFFVIAILAVVALLASLLMTTVQKELANSARNQQLVTARQVGQSALNEFYTYFLNNPRYIEEGTRHPALTWDDTSTAYYKLVNGKPEACSLGDITSPDNDYNTPCYQLFVKRELGVTNNGGAAPERPSIVAEARMRYNCDSDVNLANADSAKEGCDFVVSQLRIRQRNFLNFAYFTNTEEQIYQGTAIRPAYTNLDNISGNVFTNDYFTFCAAPTTSSKFFSANNTSPSAPPFATAASCPVPATGSFLTTGVEPIRAVPVESFINESQLNGTMLVQNYPNNSTIDLSSLPEGSVFLNCDGCTLNLSGNIVAPLTVYTNATVRVTNNILYTGHNCGSAFTPTSTTPLFGLITTRDIAITQTGSTTGDRCIDGVLFSVNGTIYVENWNVIQPAYLATNGQAFPELEVNGAIASNSRAVFAGYSVDQVTSNLGIFSGYQKNIKFDSRLEIQQPPNFISASDIVWEKLDTTEVPSGIPSLLPSDTNPNPNLCRANPGDTTKWLCS